MPDYLFQVQIVYSDASIVTTHVDVTGKDHVLLAEDEANASLDRTKYAREGLTIASVAFIPAVRQA